jgi:hypothetical protein
MGRSSTPLIVIGAALAILGVVGLAVPVFTTQKTSDIAQVGGLQIKAQEDTPHSIPPLAAGGVLLLGVVLLGGGLLRRG